MHWLLLRLDMRSSHHLAPVDHLVRQKSLKFARRIADGFRIEIRQSVQRSFQANARVITSSDQLLSDLINIVR